jgi:hypothetical protein
MHVSEIADFDYPAAFSSLDLDAVKVARYPSLRTGIAAPWCRKVDEFACAASR